MHASYGPICINSKADLPKVLNYDHMYNEKCQHCCLLCLSCIVFYDYLYVDTIGHSADYIVNLNGFILISNTGLLSFKVQILFQFNMEIYNR